MPQIPKIPKSSKCLVDLTAFLSRLAYMPGPKNAAGERLRVEDIRSEKTGEPTWGVIGTYWQFQTLARSEPREVIALADSWQDGFRQALLPTYKKKGGNNYIHAQLQRLDSSLPLLGVSVVGAKNECPGMEAEDLIAKLAIETDEPVVIVAYDKDLLQLISDQVSCWNPYTQQHLTQDNISGYLREKFLPNFQGELVPHDLAVILAITGDTQDQIYPVGGIGPVKLAEYYSKLPAGLTTPEEKLEAIARMEQATPAPKANWELARKNLAAVNLNTEKQRELVIDLPAAPLPDKEGFRKVLEDLTLRSFLTNYDKWFAPFEYERQLAQEKLFTLG